MKTDTIGSCEFRGVKLAILRNGQEIALFWVKEDEQMQLSNWRRVVVGKENEVAVKWLLSLLFMDIEKVHFPDGLEPKTAALIVWAIRHWYIEVTS